MESVNISYVKIGERKLCQITGINKQKQDMNTTIIYVLDVSGSMGAHAGNAQEVFKDLIISNNNQKTIIATFGEYSNIKKYNGREIEKWTRPTLECNTKLYDTIKNIFKLITETKEKNLFQIVIISDGGVYDLSQVLNYISTVDPVTFNQHIIQVSSIRIGTDGDTRALTCFSVFHNHPKCEQQIIDLSSFCTKRDIENALVQIFCHFSNGRSCYSGKIVSISNDLCKFPSDSLLVNSLDVNNNDFFICSNENPIINFDNKNIIITERKILTESDIFEYLKLIESKIRTIKVLGNENLLEGIVPFLNNLSIIFKNNEKTQDSKLSNMAQIKRNVLKTQGTIINQILQLININGVHKFNSQQQAQFLRQIDDNTQSGKRLAKRSNENPDDILTILNNGIKKILNGYTKIESNSEVTSFLSLSSNTDILNEALDEIKNDLDLFNLEDLLQCFGQVGLCFRATIGNYPDPWQFKVEEVYTCFLGQHDIYIAANSDKPLKVPESNNIITGVDVICYDEINNYVLERSVNKLHCSIAMRKTVADIPNDDIALKTAVIFQMIDQTMNNPLEKSVIDLWFNINTLKLITGNNKYIFGDQVFNALKLTNMDAYFTGDLNISSINKIVALLLISNSDFDLCKLARSLLSLDCYHNLKHLDIDQRSQIIMKAFEINMENRTLAKEPFEKEPDIIEFYDDYVDTNVISVAKIYENKYSKIINFVKFLHAYKNVNSYKNLLENIKNQNITHHQIFGIDNEIDLDLFISANTIQAIQSHKLECRVDVVNRKMLLMPLFKISDIKLYFKSVVSKIFKDDYERQLTIKHNNEVEREAIVQIEQLVWSCDIDEFVTKLNEFIPQRDGEKYNSLIKELSQNNSVPLLQHKIWVLTLCKVDETDDIIWNRGNMCSVKELNIFKNIWDYDTISLLSWGKLYHKWYVAPRKYEYRESDIPNRHGHCNSNPSGFMERRK